jgi:hypothetical protein
VKEHLEEWEILSARAAIEQDPEKLLKLVERINQLLELKRCRLEGHKFAGEGRRGRRVFHIAYDEMLLISRAELLEERGYEVTSVLGNNDAKRVLENGRGTYRIFLIGHAAPAEDRKEIVQWIKSRFPAAKVVALNDPKIILAEADFNFVINGPEGWLGAVESFAA